jgi:hypothetical protein
MQGSGINGAIQLGLGALASFAVGVLLKFDVAYGFNDCFNRISTYYFDLGKRKHKKPSQL